LALLLTARSLSKQFGAQPLFSGVTFTMSDGERHGLIGPNGSGKSTLLQILARRQTPDAGEVVLRKGVRLAYVEQDPGFAAERRVRDVVEAVARDDAPIEALLGQAGFTDLEQTAGSLSGGWRKRLALVSALAQVPDLLLLDEPTNHLDIDGIRWLEQTLSAAAFGCLVVSHDRYFLENIATNVMELNRAYPEGLFRAPGNYSEFLERREDYFLAQERQRESLATQVRREVEWLRRGAKARTRKAKARVDAAFEKIDELADIEQRQTTASVGIEFAATDRRTKRLIVSERIRKDLGGRTLFDSTSFALAPGVRLGLAGGNGSGKTTLLRILLGEMQPDSGSVERADGLQVVYFDQNREQVDTAVSLRRALAPEGDSVIYRDRVIHVNGWAKRFLFRQEQLDQPVARLSGGEKARLLIARLMLRPADVLLLDEPTNDLDIPTLEVLEESLLEFPGAMVLVTHDRYLLDKVTTAILGLGGNARAGLYADLAQWESEMSARQTPPSAKPQKEREPSRSASAPPRKKLSYLEQREWDSMEERIAAAEALLEAKNVELHSPEVVADGKRLEQCYQDMSQLQAEVDRLYERWSDLEAALLG
jgi:ABC transport system ATP-binding/permease protein